MIDPIVDTEIGDSKQSLFYPQIKMKKWDNKANISFRLAEDIINGSHEQHGIIDRWITDKLDCNFYNYLNGYEFGILLKRKPIKPYLTFTINTKHCDVYPQPELTSYEKSQGLVRPANVINSLSLYSPFRNNQYGVGKVGHIYRPYVVDSKGKKEWCNLTYEGNGEVRLWLDPEIRNIGKYPLWVDPTFSYTTAGSSYDAATNRIHCSQGTMGATGGTIDKVTVYGLSNGTLRARGAVYDDNSDVPNNLVDSELTGVDLSAGASWNDITGLAGSSVTGSAVYWSCVWTQAVGSGVIRVYYDTTTWNYSYSTVTYTDDAWPDPYSETGNFSNRAYSIYTTYTEGGGGGGISIPVVMHHLKQQGIS